ncbi:hypothetical protein [Devosia sp.]|uniref:hypothetical protein n=1 Tax=Devosia sp. TaxID=1871048 RepID=UPI002B00079E|nr:hypothetical protein [Devosia sp.]
MAEKHDDAGMTTSRPTPSAGPVTLAPFHSSIRSALSNNVDADTGQLTRVLITSKLDLAWQAGELVIRCSVARVAMAGREEAARGQRWARGAR